MKAPTFRNSENPVEVRVQDLLGRMSLTEKVNQLTCTMAFGGLDASDVRDGIGQIAWMAVGRFEGHRKLAADVREAQRRIIAQSPNGIPAIFHVEALTGPVLPDCASYPASIGLGASFDPEAVREMADRTRRQMVELGFRQALSPVMDLARDFRWGRLNEDYGGDPTHAAQMACAFVEGIQGSDIREGVAATAKHFLGYSQTEGGLNMSRILIDRRELREAFAKPFEAAIRKSGIKSVMNAYSAWEGMPVCASPEILTDLLRGDLGFDGLVVSDYMSIPRLIQPYRMTDDPTEAAIRCLTAGLDVELPARYGYGSNLVEAVQCGRLEESVIDRAVGRVLKLKFELGLFENPFPTFEETHPGRECFDNDDHRAHARRVTERTLTLLKNDGLLPLSGPELKLAVIGPCGDNLRVMFGTYMYGGMVETAYLSQEAMERAAVPGVGGAERPESLEGMVGVMEIDSDAGFFDEVNRRLGEAYPEARSIADALAGRFPTLTCIRGCSFLDDSATDFDAAEQAAREADAVVLAVGGKNGWGKHCTSGEGVDATIVGLHGRQRELALRVLAANPRTAIVHLDNKPLVDEELFERAAAVLEAWIPGPAGGDAIADVLTGAVNPGGRLSVDIPHSLGQSPVVHSSQNGSRRSVEKTSLMTFNGYVNESAMPIRPFGYGLGYAGFEWSGFSLREREIGADGVPVLETRVEVRNIGAREGDEVVQLYGRDLLASVVRPQQELIGFRRLTLAPGERRTVIFTFRLDQMAYPDAAGRWALEAGDFSFFAGRNSLDVQFEEIFHCAATVPVEAGKRQFFADSIVE